MSMSEFAIVQNGNLLVAGAVHLRLLSALPPKDAAPSSGSRFPFQFLAPVQRLQPEEPLKLVPFEHQTE
jgi:hypothetical protein